MSDYKLNRRALYNISGEKSQSGIGRSAYQATILFISKPWTICRYHNMGSSGNSHMTGRIWRQIHSYVDQCDHSPHKMMHKQDQQLPC